MKKILKVLSLLAFLGVLTSCEYEFVEPIEVTEDVSFSNDLIPFFNQSCNMSGCHNAGGFPPDLSPANAYQALFDDGQIDTDNPMNSKLYISLNSGTMKKYSTAAETAKVLKWIEQGAPNN
jgi:hypothetical protein